MSFARAIGISLALVLLNISGLRAEPRLIAGIPSLVEVKAHEEVLLNQVYEKFKNILVQDRKVTEPFYPIAFSTKAASLTARCSGWDAEKTATLTYRDKIGDAYEVSFRVCVPSTPSDRWDISLIGGSDRPVIEIAHTFKGERRFVKVQDDNCNAERSVTEHVCLPYGAKVYGWDLTGVQTSDLSHFEKFEVSPNTPNCLDVTFLLKGKGYNFGIDCRGSGHFRYTIDVRGTISGLN